MSEYKIAEFLTQRKDKVCAGVTPGVYLIKNATTNQYYVGQSQCPADRVFTHFSGRGNGDIYADYKNGAVFTVRFYILEKSGFLDLNELEYHLIRIYQASELGYNRRAGNRTRQHKQEDHRVQKGV